MPPKSKRKKRSKSTPKQSQTQRQSVVVNLNTSQSKSRKKSGQGGLPPPSYQHNLAPTFVMQQATDFNPVIGAISSLTSRLQQEPRIQQPVTPLSSAVQATQTIPLQSAEQLAGEAALRRAGRTAANFQLPPSQVDERLSMSLEDKPQPAENIQPLPSQSDERLSMSLEDRPQPAENVPPLPSLSEKIMTKAAQIISLQKAKQFSAGTALRRAEQLAGNLRPISSQVDERLFMSMEDKPQPVRAPDPIITERLVKKDIAVSGGGGLPEAIGFIKRGRPFAQATEAIPINQTYLIAQPAAAEEPTAEPTAEVSKQAAIFKSIKTKIDKDIELSADELVKARGLTGKEKLGKTRNNKIEKKYPQIPFV